MKKLITIVLVLAVMLSAGICSAYAAPASPKLVAALDKSSISGSDAAQEVILTVAADPGFADLAGFNFTVELPAGFSMKNVQSGDSNVKVSDMDVNLSAKTVTWTQAEAENVSVKTLAVITIAVPANVSSGKYTITVKNAVAVKDYGTVEIWETGNTTVTAAATLTVTGGNSGTETQKPNGFTDVNKNDYFYDAVLWAAEKGITTGSDPTHFNPYGITTRAQMVTFLWRACGCPEPVSKSCQFTDVVKGSYYEKAVIWAVEKGITNGTGTSTFSPGNKVTRGQAVTFLARMNGVKDDAAGYTHRFTDVKAGDYYSNAVAWAATNGITSGTGTNTFSPQNDCLRCQIVTFLYRNFVK